MQFKIKLFRLYRLARSEVNVLDVSGYLIHLTEEQILGVGEISGMSFDAPSLLNTNKSSASVQKGSGQDKKPVHIHLPFVKKKTTRCSLHNAGLPFTRFSRVLMTHVFKIQDAFALPRKQ